METLLQQSRLDFSPAPAADKIKRTPQGGILADSRPTRLGVLSYTYPNGKKVRELRCQEEVFHPDSLASLAGAPLTVNHPSGGAVTPKNWRALAKGHVGDDVRQDGKFVSATVRVQDDATAAMIERGDLKEMSCGYTADVEFTPGTWNGEDYDAVQRNIRYNHVALLPGGKGRAGREVGLRLDDCSYAISMELTHADDAVTPVVVPTQVLDAKDFVPRADFETLRAQVAVLESDLAAERKLKTDALDAVSPAAIDKLVAERLTLVSKAQGLAGKTELKLDGKSAMEIMVEAIKVAKPDMKLDGESEAFVRGVFATCSANVSAVAAAHAKAQGTARDVSAKKEDAASDECPVDAARKRMLAHNATQYSQGSN
jgi:hypothetical protein